MILHHLIHYLNRLGYPAFLIPHSVDLTNDARWPYFARFPSQEVTNPLLTTPLLNLETIDFHHSKKLTPICVVPNSLTSPPNAPFTVRYILDGAGIKDPSSSPQLVLVNDASLGGRDGTHDFLYTPLENPDDPKQAYEQFVASLQAFAKKTIALAAATPYPHRILLQQQPTLAFVEYDEGTISIDATLEAWDARQSPAKRLARTIADWTLPPKIRHLVASSSVVRKLRSRR